MGVNSAGIALLVGGCLLTPSRSAPASTDGVWPAALGNVRRAGYVAERVPDSVSLVWRESVGPGIADALVIAGPVVVVTTNRSVATVSAETAERYWSRRFGGDIAGAPVRDGATLHFATGDRDGKAYAVDLISGRTLWSRRVGAARTPSVLIDGRAIVSTMNGELVALDAATGNIAWRVRPGAAAAVAPMQHGGAMLLATAADSIYRIDKITGSVLARATLPATPAAPLLLRGDTVVAALHSGTLVGIDARTLTVVWKDSIGSRTLAPPAAAADGTVYLLTRDAEVWRIPAAGDRMKRIAALGGAATGAFTLVHDRMLVGRLDGALFLLDLDGRIIWRHDLGDSIVAPPAVHDGAVFVPLLHGDIAKLQ